MDERTIFIKRNQDIPIHSAYGKIKANHRAEGYALPREYSCYVCGESASAFGHYVLGEDYSNREENLNKFEDIAKKLRLHYLADKKRVGEITISACSRHVPNLNGLEREIIDNKGKINEMMIRSSLI